MSLAIEAFIENIRIFGELIESDPHDVVAVRQTLLALLQGIPYLETTGAEDSDVESPHRELNDWTKERTRFSNLPLQYYRMVFDPLDPADESSVVGDVCDDVADIYLELRHGLQAYDAGATIHAVHHWRDSYRDHWGHHAVGALSALDAYIRQNVG